MATKESGEFEKALGRLEEIVQTLDGGDVRLDESVALYKEARALALRCEHLLKEAQAAVEAAQNGAAQSAAAQSGEGGLPF